jgi:hypothetical protein
MKTPDEERQWVQRTQNRRKEDREQQNIRVWFGTLFVLMCITSGLVWFLTQHKFSDLNKTTQNKFANVAVRQCQAQNEIRRESNARIPKQIEDAHNLIRSLEEQSKTRGSESMTWASIEALFVASAKANGTSTTPGVVTLETEVNNLIATFKADQKVVKSIEKAEKKISFSRLPIVDCAKAVKQPD